MTYMDKQILKAVEAAYRKGLRDGNAIKDISPYLITSQFVAHEVANKFCKARVIKSVCDHNYIVHLWGTPSEYFKCKKCGKIKEQTVL